jgi:hypothetical protein
VHPNIWLYLDALASLAAGVSSRQGLHCNMPCCCKCLGRYEPHVLVTPSVTVLQQILENQVLILKQQERALPFLKIAVKQLFKAPSPSQASRGSNKSFRKRLLKFYGMKPQNGQVGFLGLPLVRHPLLRAKSISCCERRFVAWCLTSSSRRRLYAPDTCLRTGWRWEGTPY